MQSGAIQLFHDLTGNKVNKIYAEDSTVVDSFHLAVFALFICQNSVNVHHLYYHYITLSQLISPQISGPEASYKRSNRGGDVVWGWAWAATVRTLTAHCSLLSDLTTHIDLMFKRIRK